jgi:hypothetical protein
LATTQVTKLFKERTLSIHLQKFIERVRGNDARGGKDFVMPMKDAKGMAADLTELLLELRSLKEAALLPQKEEVIEIKLSGGKF